MKKTGFSPCPLDDDSISKISAASSPMCALVVQRHGTSPKFDDESLDVAIQEELDLLVLMLSSGLLN